MKTILAPVDFSAVSRNAAEFAGNLAAFYGATLWLYHCYEPPIVFSEYTIPFITNNEVQSAAEHELDLMKKDIIKKNRFHTEIFTKAEMAGLQYGLDAFSEEINPDIIVMGLSGSNALSRIVVGSNTIKAVHNLKYPVLVVPPRAQFIPIRKIGFACDFKKVVEKTPIHSLEKIIRDFNAELHVMNVDFNHGKFTQELLDEGKAVYSLLRPFKPEYHTVEAPDVSEGINWFTDTKKIDWIVAIPKKHNLMEKLFKRSHTKELLHHTHVPVLCMHE